jgi:predicted nucleic acid-binding protein
LVEINHLNHSFNLPDLSDEIYLKTAIEANCDFLITGNLKDFPKKEYDNLRIVSALDFLKLYQLS